jgi:thiol-disulfide isomerase/thioredoxin
MKKFSILFIASIFYSMLIFGQQKNVKSFILEGTINVDTGKMVLIILGDSSLYPESARHLKAKIRNGKFVFRGEMLNPLGYWIQTEDRSYSSPLVVFEPGKQTIICNLDSLDKMPLIDNQVMEDFNKHRESTTEFRKKSELDDKEYAELRKKYPSGLPEDLKLATDIKRQSNYDEGDRNLLKFVKENPASYWALWRLTHLMQFGYEKIFSEIYLEFNDSIKNSYSGLALAKVLKNSEILSVGNTFPKMNLLNIKGNKSAGLQAKKNKYTLVDFWYTKCGPCIARFPGILEVYDAYHAKGFEVACIATDAIAYKKDLPIVIKQHNLKWLHYWDLNGKGAHALSIHAFPTNYLLDGEGKIVQKNITASELAVLLKKNL